MTEPVEPKVEEESKEANEEEEKKEEEKKEEPTEEATEESKEANEEEEKKEEEKKEENQYASLIKEIIELAEDSEKNKRESLFGVKNGSHIDYVPQFRVLMQLE